MPRPPRARGACVLADKTETLELYISILGLDKRYERKLYSLGLSELHEELVGSREQFRWEEDRARNWIETEREREEERRLCCLSSSIDRFGPLCPKGAKDLITKILSMISVSKVSSIDFSRPCSECPGLQ